VTEARAREGGDRILTNRQGHPVHDNQNQRTIGPRGPATLENYQFLEKISHFDRERIPERVVHARGFLSYGTFTATGKWGDEPIERYTRAKLFAEEGKQTPVALRFSTVIGGRDSSEAARDPRGFAIKFYTEDGNWDLVGNNLGVFFIRDAIKFPDVIHSLKPDPVTFRQEPARIFDFMSQTPESMHMLVNLFSPRGIPADYRHMQGFGVNTYRWENAEGETKLVKYHWMPRQGVASMTEEDAAAVQAQDLGHASKDLYEAIERGDYPEWDLLVQMMDDHDHPELDFDPLDDTKVWPEEVFPPKKVGTLQLNRNVENSFAENEQSMGGLSEAGYPHADEIGPVVTGRLTRARIPRTNDYAQAGERFRLMQDWERDDLVKNFVANISQATPEVQKRMVWHFYMCEDELGRRVGEGLGIALDDVKDLEPLPKQTLNEEERKRLENLGGNGPRDVEGHQMTHCVPNEHRTVAAA
jgi:catalase